MNDSQELQLARSVNSTSSVANSSMSLIARGRKEAASLRQDHEPSKIAAIRDQAEQGNAGAQYTLAEELSRAMVIEGGKFLPNPGSDEAEAIHWYRAAAEQGHCEAQYELGSRYAEGKGVPKDETEAVCWLRRAAEQDHLYAIVDLAYRYHEGIGIPSDHETAVRLCSRAVEIELPDIEQHGWDPEDHTVIDLAANFGHAGAQNVVGQFYSHDYYDRKPDYEEAAKWFRRAAEQGYARAQLNLGRLYHDGDGVPQDDKEALGWARLAAEQGYAEAQFTLGLVYENGQGVPQDHKEAGRWYTLAAEQGDASAQFNLGYKYYNGRGVPKDYKEAVRWYKLAAEQGHATAQNTLGYMYDNEQGVPQD